jgi:uncharacterized membrane protein
MHPYRTRVPPQPPKDLRAATDDRWLLWMLLAVGAVPIAVALLHRDSWGVEPTTGLLLVLLAARALAAHYRRALRRALRR